MVHSVETLVLHTCSHGHFSPLGISSWVFCDIAMRSISDGAGLIIEKSEEVKNNRIMQAVADLFPGYFALVMATGVISTATFLLEMKWAVVTRLRSSMTYLPVPPRAETGCCFPNEYADAGQLPTLSGRCIEFCS